MENISAPKKVEEELITSPEWEGVYFVGPPINVNEVFDLSPLLDGLVTMCLLPSDLDQHIQR